MFLALGFFFLDNSVKNMAQKCTREKSVESSRHISLWTLPSEVRAGDSKRRQIRNHYLEK